MSEAKKRPREDADGSDAPAIFSAPHQPGQDGGPFSSLSAQGELELVTDILPVMNPRMGAAIQQLPYSSPQISCELESLRGFFQQRYQTKDDTKGTSNASRGTCWHYRLREELWLGLICGEHWLPDQQQEMGSELYNTMVFLTSINNEFIPSFHANSGPCFLKTTKRNFEPGQLSPQQQSMLYQLSCFWLHWLRDELYNYHQQQNANAARQPGQSSPLTVLDVIQNIFSGDWYNLIDPKPPSISISAAIPSTYASGLHATISEYEKNGPSCILLHAFQQLPDDKKNAMLFTYTTTPPNDLSYTQQLLAKHFTTAYCHKYNPVIYPIFKADTKNIFGVTDLTQLDSNPDNADPRLAKNYTTYPLCIHERLRREILLTLQAEIDIVQFIKNDNPRILLSFLWGLLSNQTSLCPAKSRCAKSDIQMIYQNDYFSLNSTQYIRSLLDAIPMQERITLYRYAQNLLYGVINNTISQHEMLSWCFSGIGSRKNNQCSYDNILSIAIKTMGAFQPIILDAIAASPYGESQAKKDKVVQEKMRLQIAKQTDPANHYPPTNTSPASVSPKATIKPSSTSANSDLNHSAAGAPVGRNNRRRRGDVSSVVVAAPPLNHPDVISEIDEHEQGGAPPGDKDTSQVRKTHGGVAPDIPQSSNNNGSFVHNSTHPTLQETPVESDNRVSSVNTNIPQLLFPDFLTNISLPVIENSKSNLDITKSDLAPQPVTGQGDEVNLQNAIVSAEFQLKQLSGLPFIDVSTQSGVGSYIEGLSSIAGHYRAINPNSIHAQDPSSATQCIRLLARELSVQHEHNQILQVLVSRLAAESEAHATELELVKSLAIALHKQFISLKSQHQALQTQVNSLTYGGGRHQ